MTDQEPGYVRPLSEDGTPDLDALTASQPRSRRGAVIGGVVLAVVAAGAVGGVVLWRSLVGSAFAATEAVPPDADFVVTFDLLQLRDSEQLERLVSAFTGPAVDQGLIDADDADWLTRLDEVLFEEAGFTLADDVAPWIGRSVSIAGWLPDGFDFANPYAGDEPGGVLVVSVRDRDGAAAFLDKLVSSLEETSGDAAVRTSLRGGELVAVDDDSDSDLNLQLLGFYGYLDDERLILATSRDEIERGLDARDGESLADDADFAALMDALPANRLVAGYVATDWVADAVRSAPLDGEAPAGIDQFIGTIDETGAFAGSITLEGEGVAFDLVAPAVEGQSSVDASVLTFPERLPDETLAFFGSPLPDDAIGTGLESWRDIDPFLYDDTVGGLEEMLGFDLVGDVLPALGREIVVAAVGTPEGMFRDQFGVDIGIVGGIGVLARGPVEDAVGALEDMAAEGGISVRSLGNVSVIGDEFSDFFAYGVGDDALAVGTGPAVVEALLSGAGDPVTTTPLYQQLDGLLPGDGMVLYVDMHGIYNAVNWQDPERGILDPLVGIGAADETTGGLVHGRLMVLVDY
jgi:hypothetical protein